jgi:hypothetical protein
VVTDQTATAEQDDTAKFQALFTKQQSDAKSLSFQDACSTLMREGDSIASNTQLFVTQFVRELDQKIRKGEESEDTAAAYELQNYELKQKFQKKVQELQGIIKLQESKLKEQSNRIGDLQIQLQQVSHARQMVSASTAGSSSRPHTIENKTSRSLPFVRRMHNIEKEDLAKERSLNQQKGSILGRSREGSESFASHSYSSGRRGHYQPYPPNYSASKSY